MSSDCSSSSSNSNIETNNNSRVLFKSNSTTRLCLRHADPSLIITVIQVLVTMAAVVHYVNTGVTNIHDPQWSWKEDGWDDC
jgi:hypothetical protein